MIDTGNARRLDGTTMLTKAWDASGALRPGLTASEAARTLWLLTSAELYFNSVDRFGWNADEYESWLVEVAHREILGPVDTKPSRDRPER